MIKVIRADRLNIDIAHSQLGVIDFLLKERGYFYCLCAGSLLGCIRHQSLMSWDDDVDLLMLDSELTEFEREAHELGYIVHQHILDYEDFYRFTILEIYGIHIDIWPIKICGDVIKTLAGDYKYSDIFPVKRQKMAYIETNIPQKPEVLLDRVYKDWRTHIVKKVGPKCGGLFIRNRIL